MANEFSLKNIMTIARHLGIANKDLIPYGKYMAKIEPKPDSYSHKSHLILVTAMTPTKAGEGKTTTVIALTDGLNLLLKGKAKAVAALRQPSMGPVFGMKGGATGGGLASIEPDEDININFTGDIHALTAANALISAVIDNSIFNGNEYDFDLDRIVFPRAVDMNDRALRRTIVGIDKKHPSGRNETFVITAASELMAVFCLARDASDFKQRVGKIIVGFTKAGKPVTVKDLKITNAVFKIMHSALKPNLVQTIYGSPAIVHGGPFANIAHGCCSYMAIKTAMDYADYTITEAGFGSELGGEKFLDILAPRFNLRPDGAVVVATVRSLKLQGGSTYDELDKEDVGKALEGLPNLLRHLNNIRSYGLPIVCCLNVFPTDTPRELQAVKDAIAKAGFKTVECDSYQKGKKGGLALAKAVVELAKEPDTYRPLVKAGDDIKKTIATISTNIYGAGKVEYSANALADIENIESLGIKDLNVCIAKTPLSLTDDPKVLGAPVGFTIHIDHVNLSAGAGFVVPVSGKTLLMPGLPKVPAAVTMESEK